MRTAGLLLALFALTFKAMLPSGFMLDANAGRVAVTLCNGGETYFDPLTGEFSHPGDAPAQDNGAEHGPFAFTSAPVLAEPAVLAAPPAPAYVYAPPALAREAAGVHEATGPPLPARGPPLNT
ncbi:MAG: hypothetical protein R3C16_03790 [Hyphomonadaceae bacterium]